MVQAFMSELNTYVQGFGSALQTILDSVWSVQDAAFDKEMDELDKTIDSARQKYQRDG